MSISRRHFLAGASALAGTAAIGQTTQSPRTQPIAGSLPPGTPVYQSLVPPQLPTLRQAGASRNLPTGCAVSIPALRSDPGYAQLIRQQAGIVVAEDAMKFGPLRPTPDQFFFDDADLLMAFAQANGMQVRGHNFVWHHQLPDWFASYVTPANAEAVLVRHIETVAARYAGRMQSWDVVNEAILLSDALPGGLRNTPWYRLLGPRYLDIAFHAARRADPTALLCYNDYGLEGEVPEEAAKGEAVLALLRGMQARGVPIDAVGLQSHLVAHAGGYGGGLQHFMQQAQAMGLKIILTEFDVNDRYLSVEIASRDEVVAALYRSYLNLTLPNPNVIALLTWGLTDRYTWLNINKANRDPRPERSLPFDADLHPTLAYVAAVEAIQAARPRPL